MSRQFWSEALAWATANGTAVANSTTETIVFPNITIPGNYMQDGRVLRLSAWGQYGTTATPTLTFSLRWNGVAGTVFSKTGAAVTTSGTGSGATMTALWRLSALVQTRSNGSTGTLFADGEVVLWTSTVPTAGTVTNYGMSYAMASGLTGGITPVASTLDLTADTPLSLTVTWGTANSANSVQGNMYVVESLN